MCDNGDSQFRNIYAWKKEDTEKKKQIRKPYKLPSAISLHSVNEETDLLEKQGDYGSSSCIKY